MSASKRLRTINGGGGDLSHSQGIDGRHAETRFCFKSTGRVATAASWAIYGAVKEWFNTLGRPAAEEVVPMIMQFIIPILQAGASKDAEPVSVHH